MPTLTQQTSCSGPGNKAFVIVTLLFLLPAGLVSQESEIVIGDEEMFNDDLIVASRTGAECPPDDEDECEYGTHPNNENALIFPRSVTTTKKTRRPSTTVSSLSQTPVKIQSTAVQETSSTSCGGGKKGTSTGTGSDNDDEEDCSDESSGTSPDTTIEEPGQVIDLSTIDAVDPAFSREGHPALPTPLPTHTTTASVPHRDDALGSSASDPGSDVPFQPKSTAREGDKVDDHIDDPVWISNDPASSVNKDQFPPIQHQHQTPSVGGFWSKFLTTVNINIYLMIAIAAAFVLLLMILIIAVCKYTGNGSRHHHSHRRSAKSQSTGGGGAGVGGGNTGVCGSASGLSPCPGNKSGYAYEACNTSPPQMHHHQMSAASAPPLVVNATPMNAPHGVHGASVCTPCGNMIMMSQSQYPLVQTPMNDVSKPIVKKDVKEWYV